MRVRTGVFDSVWAFTSGVDSHFSGAPTSVHYQGKWSRDEKELETAQGSPSESPQGATKATLPLESGNVHYSRR